MKHQMSNMLFQSLTKFGKIKHVCIVGVLFPISNVILCLFLFMEMKHQNIQHAFQEPHKINIIKQVGILGVPSPTNLLYVEIRYMYS